MPRDKPGIPEMTAIRKWLDQAECRNHSPALFDTVMTYKAEGPPDHRRVTGRRTVIDDNVERARDICAGCPVMMQCLEHAVAYDVQTGVWGGLVYEEREQWLDRETAPVVAA